MTAPEQPDHRAIRARYVFPVLGQPLRDGVVTIQRDRIVAVGARDGQPIEDLGHVAILPGLVNAHTHLEFSGLDSRLAEPGTPLPQWIGRVIEHRKIRAGSVEAAITQGLRESLAAGVTSLGEIATSVWPDAAWPADSTGASLGPCPDVTVFLELFALSQPRIAERLAAAEKFLAARADAAFRPALSPHAPYTVHPELLAQCVVLSRRFRAPLAMHLAEAPEELQLLDSASGPFRDLLESLGVWSPQAFHRGGRVLEYLCLLSAAERVLVIHGNYLNRTELAFLAERAGRMSVVYCPRTHDYFRHAPYPLAEMLSRGVALALGTDSRASNPDLSLFNEMRFAARRHPAVSPKQILELGTIAGARALGIDGEAGSLTAGKRADLAIVALPERDAADPHELLLDDAAHVVQTWLGGREYSAR